MRNKVNGVCSRWHPPESLSRPETIIAFLESTDYEDAVRNAVSLGGDSDTLACIAGAIAEAHYGPLPASIRTGVEERLPADLWQIAGRFCRTYCPGAV